MMKINDRKVFLTFLRVFCLSISATISFAQKPSGLMCDLISHTQYSSVDGYIIKTDTEAQRAREIKSVKIVNRHPAFSWIMNSGHVGARQTAYQIVVTEGGTAQSSQMAPFWDSRKVSTTQSAAVLYTGPSLLPGHSYNWKVRIWDERAAVSPFADPVGFTMGNTLTDYSTERYPIEKTDQLPVHLTKIKDKNTYLMDFGKDAFGQIKVRLTTLNPNDTVTIRLGEVLDDQNQINRHPEGTIRYSEYRLPLQKGTHLYHLTIRSDKRNTGKNAVKMPAYIGEVTPFRYCEVAGYSGALKPKDVIRAFVHYPFNNNAATFHSSDTLLNKIWELCKYSVEATSYAGVYVDGDRERIPYEADAYINQLCHYAVDREYSLARYSHEYLIDHATWPTEWILQSVLIAGNDFMYTGDIRSAQHFYKDLQAKTLMSLEDKNGLISSKNITPALLETIHVTNKTEPNGIKDIVDWPHSGGLGLPKGYGGETDGFVFTDYNAVVNAFYYKALVTMQLLADALGKTQDARMYQQKAASLKLKYRALFWDNKKGLFCDGITTRHSSLHSNAFALALGLAEPADLPGILAFIRSRGMACSVYGSQFVLDAIYDGQDGGYGLKLLTAKTDRSWYNMIKVGSTLTLEAWDNKYKPNQDWNHIWGAAPANIISRKLMGVEPITPGWATFKIAPQPGSLKSAVITVPTIKGTISVEMAQTDKQFSMKTSIPANTTADVYLPSFEPNDKVLMDNRPIKSVKKEGRWLVAQVRSGSHQFLVKSK